ncbi:P-loop containing nucleoside triphosphate hydrolase protein [Biscogniauxia mediterranea]|nr:P-loop containing nucleoside triphosphate hydrolase protein [Biscogniauxia mediterranea]
MTGSGKTTFISKVTGRSDLAIGHSLTSCTRDIQVIETKIDGRTVRFVDTPGFSDTTLSDSEVLQLIADYLATAYKSEIKLSGIIYLHPISDTRVTHHATKNLQMFQKLTGDTNLKNVLLVTSMWDKVTEAQGLAREQELKDKFWKIMLAYGAKSIRHNGTPESAERIAQMLMKNEPFYLQLQKEMGENNMTLRDTAAGREVMAEISKMKEEHQREIAEMETMMQNSANENKFVIEALKEHYQTLLSDMEKTLKDERRMNEAAVQSLNERIAALEKKGVCAVM